jgi:hypothetical protein
MFLSNRLRPFWTFLATIAFIAVPSSNAAVEMFGNGRLWIGRARELSQVPVVSASAPLVTGETVRFIGPLGNSIHPLLWILKQREFESSELNKRAS